MELLAPFYLAFVSRLHGGGFFKLPKAIKTALWALPFGGLAWFMLSGAEYSLPLIAAGSTTSFALCFAGKATGHGGFMDYGSWNKPRKEEALEFIIAPLRGRVPEKFYDAIGLCLVGVASVSGAVIAACVAGYSLAALCIATGGAAKSAAYMIGWALQPHIRPDWWDDLDEPTEVGEILSGFFAGLGLVAAFALL